MKRMVVALRVAALWAAAWALALVTAITYGQPAVAASKSDALQSPEPLVDLGRALFHGQRAWSAPPRLPSDVALPADAAACGRCHGARGEGSREGGVAVPALRHADAAAMVQAASTGEAMGGRRLAAPMPRYSFTPQEQQALLAYLAQLGSATDNAAGVDASTVHLAMLAPRTSASTSAVAGTVAPSDPATRSAADQAVQAMQAHIARVNAAGGTFGRALRLHVIEFEPGSADVPDALLQALQRRQIFALVGSLIGPVPDAWSRVLAEHQTPMVANLLPAAQAPQTPWVTHLMPALSDQWKQAALALQQRCGGQALWLVQATKHAGLGDALALPPERVLTGTAPPATARCVLSLLPAAQHQQLKTYLQASGDKPKQPPVVLGALAMVSGPLTGDVAPGVAELSLSPLLPQRPGSNVWATLGELAARTAVEALSRSGRDLHPLALRRALESMQGFDAMPGVRLQFSPHQRAGLALVSHWSPSP